jgi:dGTPase
MQALFEVGVMPPLEGQIASLADQLAYVGHDTEDAVSANLLDWGPLDEVRLWREAAAPWRSAHPGAPLAALTRPIVDAMIDRLLDDAAAHTASRLRESRVDSVDAVRRLEHGLVDFSPPARALVAELRAFLLDHFYRHHRLIRMDAKARRFVREVFRAYSEQPRMLPPRFAARIEEQGAQRVICDYIAGMTDRYCQDEYKRLFEPFERV